MLSVFCYFLFGCPLNYGDVSYGGQGTTVLTHTYHLCFIDRDRDMAVDRDTISSFVEEGSGQSEILKEEAEKAKNEDLAVC